MMLEPSGFFLETLNCCSSYRLDEDQWKRKRVEIQKKTRKRRNGLKRNDMSEDLGKQNSQEKNLKMPLKYCQVEK